MNWEETKAFLTPCFPEEVQSELELLYPGELREIHVRVDRPAVLVTAARKAALQWRPTASEVEQLAETLSEHSLYARESETRRDFLRCVEDTAWDFADECFRGKQAHEAYEI